MLKTCVVLFIVSLSLYIAVGSFPIDVNKIKDSEFENLKMVLILLERFDELFSHLSRPRYGRSAIPPTENASDEKLIPCSNQLARTCRLTLDEKFTTHTNLAMRKWGKKGQYINSFPSVQGSYPEPGPSKGLKSKRQEQFSSK
ncbi:uncharacterized protein TNCT_10011 [Trichonephila clavata]|uniref:Uncharacterized protein n=1 Tax=Trichonephila clavata TaxID=2740835 RepID=A0A8X6I3N6_TRICU|nr:uncharacterized protein TNCT_10011 [Trichonephila clavata]